MSDHVTNPVAVHAAVIARLDRRWRVEGQLSFPAAPSLIDLYLRRLALMFASIGKKFSNEEIAHMRTLLEPRLIDGFRDSPHCRLHIKWESEPAPAIGIDYRVWLETGTVQDQYEHWAATKTPPLFGTHPDSKLVDLAATLGDPAQVPILDIGAGTGRNSLPMARKGHATDALEITEAFCKTIGEAAETEGLPLRVVSGDVLAPTLELEHGRYALIVCAEVTSHFRGPANLRLLFERASAWLRPGGTLLVNGFVAVEGHEPTAIEREMSQVVWSTVFTRADFAAAADGLPLSLVSDERVHDYEKEHQPKEDWPPTGWFEDWSRGFDLYGVKGDLLPPMELRWMTYRKQG
jgi:2-polyprenyl-3-methyl-5-hydroxy-6-metoxy-1,4-benzoquinol methylase